MNLISIEGASFSGKTTLLNYLKNKKDVFIIHEYANYIGGHKNFPVFPPRSTKEAIKSVDFFISIEEKRANTINKLLASKPDIVFVSERCPYSFSLFQKYVHEKLTGSPSCYEYCVEEIKKKTISNEIYLPNKIVYLFPDENSFYLRVKKRGKVSFDFMNQYEFSTYAKDYFTNEVKKAYDDNSFYIINTTNNTQDEQFDEIWRHIIKI